MPSDMAQAQADLIAEMKTSAGESVTYRRGAHSVTLTAVPGRSVMQIIDQSGSALQETLVDFAIAPDDLILNGVTTFPEVGDTIDRTINGDETATYEVRGDGSLVCYEIDPLRTTIRVHTKLKAVTT